MKSKIAAVVVLYNPDVNFTDNIYSYIDDVSILIIIDNSEKTNPTLFKPLFSDSRIKFIFNNENTGIAKALNAGIKLASANNFEWVLTMDQDSYFGKSMIRKYIEDFDKMPDKTKIAVVGPVIDSIYENKNTGKIKNVTSLITSGSLINVSVFSEIDGYNENLFIDEVDHEYCYRAKLAGYSILQFEEIFLEHSLGQKISVDTISGVKKIKTFHSPLRLYYIVRNCCYIISKYKKVFPQEIRLKRKDLLVRIKNNLLYGSKKISSLKYIVLGFIHYKRNRFGKL